ncbi:MAG: phosphoenolpyruvate mutase, partial [Gammaproteobacteria bacterium]
GRWIGMLAARGAGARRLGATLDTLATRADFATLGMRDLLNALIDAGQRVHVVYVNGHWLDVNSLSDLEHAGAFTSGQR